MVTLRPYQDRAVENCRNAFAFGSRRTVLVLATGAGKMVIGHEIASRVAARGKRVLWLVHRRELVDQASKRMPVPCAVLMAGRQVGDAPVIVASLQTIAAREARPEADFIVFDEAHHGVAATYRAVIEQYPSARVLGLTATPERADGRGLGEVFDTLIVGPTTRELIEAGHLVPPHVIGPSEYSEALARDPVEAWKEHASDRRGFIFCSSIAHSLSVSAAMTDTGFPCGHVDANTRPDVRDRLVSGFRAGSIRALSSVYVFTEGVDVPEASVCMLARGCGHAGPYLQMAGRVLRPAPGKPDALILDLRGVTHLHGLPEDERQYSLGGKGIAQQPSLPALSQCSACGAVYRARPVCPRCGFRKPVEDPEVVDRELRYLSGTRPYACVEDKRKELSRLRSIQQAKGYRPGWVIFRFKAVFGHFPPRGWIDD